MARLEVHDERRRRVFKRDPGEPEEDSVPGEGHADGERALRHDRRARGPPDGDAGTHGGTEPKVAGAGGVGAALDLPVKRRLRRVLLRSNKETRRKRRRFTWNQRFTVGHCCLSITFPSSSTTRSLIGRLSHSSRVTGLLCAQSRAKSSSSRAASCASRAARFTSSLMPKLRLSKFVEPTTDQIPSISRIFAWIIAGWYSLMRTPPLSRSP